MLLFVTVHVSKKKKNWYGGGCVGCCQSEFFSDFWIFFSLTKPLKTISSNDLLEAVTVVDAHIFQMLIQIKTISMYSKKVQVYSLISSLKTYHPTLHLTPWSLDLFISVPFQLHGEHTVLQPFRRIELIVHIAISVLTGTHFNPSQVKHFKVKCLAQGHNFLSMSQD